MELLVSVIVPVYKVENEIYECIDSIINQTYQNLEILLVDDGSPDSCGDICDKYALRDSRIQVFHNDNRGLSATRNYALDKCKGEYIVCVDSDDILHNEFISTMIFLAEKHNAEMVVCPYQKFYEKEELFEDCKNMEVYIAEKEDAIKKMFYQNVIFHTGAHSKLYKKDIFSGVRYPTDLYYEDLATTYRLILNSSKVIGISKKMYGYRIRKESIMRQGYNEKMLSCIVVSRQFYKDVSPRSKELMKAASSRAFSVNRAIYLKIPYNKKEERKKVWRELKKYRQTVLLDNNARIRERIMALISYFGAEVFHLFSALYLKHQMRI